MIQFIEGGACAPAGFKAAGIHCGLRKNRTKKDLALILSDVPAAAAAVYTTNLVKGAPIHICREHLENGRAQAIICNSGNANTCNGDGYEKASIMAAETAKALNLQKEDILVASTGVIGQPLPIEPILTGLEPLVSALSLTGSNDACEAIMTTDTMEKEYAISCKLGGKICKLGGIVKGSGMIAPNMATMLGFLTTDVNIAPKALQKALSEAVTETFNQVSVDGDTSTNDMVAILANGLADNAEITENSSDYNAFVEILTTLCKKFAMEIARDGEGATKLLIANIQGAKTKEDARQIGKTVISSSLVKSAFFGADANWGRILCAIGYSGVKVDVMKISVAFRSDKGEILVCKDGSGVNFSEETAKEILLRPEIEVLITLEEGDAEGFAYGCDLTYDYVKINGDYRT